MLMVSKCILNKSAQSHGYFEIRKAICYFLEKMKELKYNQFNDLAVFLVKQKLHKIHSCIPSDLLILIGMNILLRLVGIWVYR